MKRWLFLFLLIAAVLPNLCVAQIGGEATFAFLNLASSPLAAALGGKIAAFDEHDASLVIHNPALLSADMHNHLSFAYVGFLADVKYGSASYSRSLGRMGNASIGFQRVGYGDFDASDVSGSITGTFDASETVANVSYSYAFDSLLTVGVNAKSIFSSLEQYSAFGLAADIGVAYRSRNGLFSAGLVLRNMGSMLKTYTQGNYEPIPFDIVGGISYKLQHAPFRFVVTLHQLHNWNLWYERQEEEDAFGLSDNNKPSAVERFGNELLSHVVFGVEFTPIRGFYLRGGYNYQRRNELKVEEKVGAVGFSWGVGVKISKFNISYSRAFYHLAGGSSHFSISTSLSSFARGK